MRRNSFARSRGGRGGKGAPPSLSMPFCELDERSQAEQDADMSPLRIIIGLICGVVVWTFTYTIGKAIRIFLGG